MGKVGGGRNTGIYSLYIYLFLSLMQGPYRDIQPIYLPFSFPDARPILIFLQDP